MMVKFSVTRSLYSSRTSVDEECGLRESSKTGKMLCDACVVQERATVCVLNELTETKYCAVCLHRRAGNLDDLHLRDQGIPIFGPVPLPSKWHKTQ